MSKRASTYLFLTVTAIFLTGCTYSQPTVKSSYQALSISQQAYDGAMITFADLVKQGHINNETKIKILEYATIYFKAHNSAVDALVAYTETENAQDLHLVEKQITVVSSALEDLMEIIKPYLLDEGGS